MPNPGEAWVPNVLSAPLPKPHYGRNDDNGMKKRRIIAKFICYALRSGAVAESMIPHGYPEEKGFDLCLAVLCMTATEIDNSKYNFFLNDLAVLQTEIPSLLEANGQVTTMLEALQKKAKAFRDNYEFVDITSDLREGTTATLDTISSYLDSAFAVHKHDDEGEGAEEGSEEEEEGVLPVQI